MPQISGSAPFKVPPPPLLSATDQISLLSLARAAVESTIRGEPSGGLPAPTPELEQPAGVFVTIFRGRELRGCIGLFRTEESLWAGTREMASAAASRDPRFPPIESWEIPALRLELSILGELAEVPPAWRDRQASFFLAGEHGACVRKDERCGLLLPQVAQAWGWDGPRFLREVCAKAKLPVEAWLDASTELQLFRVIKVQEAEEPEAAGEPPVAPRASPGE